MTAVFRLAGAAKNQRRVNALQHIFIPEYEETVAFIVSTLEERDREETFRLKLLKTRSGKSKNTQKEPKTKNSSQEAAGNTREVL